jgi:sugar phosphate isomerase/epimerase
MPSPYQIGVMQGRLLPKYQGRYQAHPVYYWVDEFAIASKLGLDCIEFIFDFNDFESNPLLTREGRSQIQSLEKDSGVKVLSICADYFMEAPLHKGTEQSIVKSLNVLNELIDGCSELSVGDIVIPCVDQSRIDNYEQQEIFCRQITKLLPKVEQFGINLSLETDLPPGEFKSLLVELDHPRITVNYDTGNSASNGFDPLIELQTYGDKISDLHIKDRVLGGGPVELGTGDCNFQLFFQEFKKLDFNGPIILQAYRDEEGVEIFKKQLSWFKQSMNQYKLT